MDGYAAWHHTDLANMQARWRRLYLGNRITLHPYHSVLERSHQNTRSWRPVNCKRHTMYWLSSAWIYGSAGGSHRQKPASCFDFHIRHYSFSPLISGTHLLIIIMARYSLIWNICSQSREEKGRLLDWGGLWYFQWTFERSMKKTIKTEYKAKLQT